MCSLFGYGRYGSYFVNKISTSNWVCENATTRDFHQEHVSSYTVVAVPHWDREELRGKKLRIGNTKFVFRWIAEGEDSQESYLPLELYDGLSVVFTGFSCFHRQEIVEDDYIDCQLHNLREEENVLIKIKGIKIT